MLTLLISLWPETTAKITIRSSKIVAVKKIRARVINEVILITAKISGIGNW